MMHISENKHYYTLDNRLYTRLRNRFGPDVFKCRMCIKPINLGEKVFSRKSTGKYSRGIYLYHPDCARSVGEEIPI